MSASSTYIPRRLDDQWKVGLWDMDVAVPWLMVFMLVYTSVGGFMGLVLAGVGASFVGQRAAKLKADKHPAFVMHWAYWNLPEFVVRFNATPASCHRRMIG